MIKKIKKLVIVSGYGYYGGNVVMDRLCAELRLQGIDARLLMVPFYPMEQIDTNVYKTQIKQFRYKTTIRKAIIKLTPFIDYTEKAWYKDLLYFPVSGVKLQYNPEIDDETIVIYPEIVYGNPLGAENVVRWLLYYYKYEKYSNAFSLSDKFVCFREIFNSETLNPKRDSLYIKHFDNNLYRQYNFGERKGNCYILRKGKGRKDLPEKFDGPVFDDNMTQEELVRMFNTYKYCYSYDTQTFYTSIAAVCGCIPIVIMEPGKTVDDYLSGSETRHFGIAWGNTPEQIQYAIDTRDKLLESLDYTKMNRENTSKFIEYLKQHFCNE